MNKTRYLKKSPSALVNSFKNMLAVFCWVFFLQLSDIYRANNELVNLDNNRLIDKRIIVSCCHIITFLITSLQEANTLQHNLFNII